MGGIVQTWSAVMGDAEWNRMMTTPAPVLTPAPNPAPAPSSIQVPATVRLDLGGGVSPLQQQQLFQQQPTPAATLPGAPAALDEPPAPAPNANDVLMSGGSGGGNVQGGSPLVRTDPMQSA